VIVRDTEAEAREYAEHLVSKLDDEYGKLIRDRALDSISLGVSHQAKARELADQFGYVEPHLWTGIGPRAVRLRRGAGRLHRSGAVRDRGATRRWASAPSSSRAIRISTNAELRQRVLPQLKTCSLPRLNMAASRRGSRDTTWEPESALMDRVSARELELSRIVYGMWRLGDDADTSPAHVQAKVEACLAQGITTMDQADIYGGYGAEALLGAAFKAARACATRSSWSPNATSSPHRTLFRRAGEALRHLAAHILASVEHSLQPDGDRPDRPSADPPARPIDGSPETGKALDELVASGKVRAVGVSNFRPWDWSLLQSAMETPLVTNQIESAMHLEPSAMVIASIWSWVT
jgi:hypothetical protein